MIDGIVSNCWQSQFAAGDDLDEMIQEASRRGFRAIELRQGSIAGYETIGRAPVAEELMTLPSRFPGIRFNIACELVFLHPDPRVDSDLFSAARWAAGAVAGETPPHLRLVDLSTTNADWEDVDEAACIQHAARRVAQLTHSLIELDGVLSLEHARQRWDLFRAVFDAARQQLGRDADRLKICFDPCNLLAADEAVDPATVAASLSAESISMVHYKQRRDGEPFHSVSEGDLDWRSVNQALRTIGYAGPRLLEIPPDEEIWNHLESSRDYLHGLDSP